MATGEPRSPQLVSWAAGVGVAAATLALTRHPGAAVAAFATTRAVLGKLRTRGGRRTL